MLAPSTLAAFVLGVKFTSSQRGESGLDTL